MAKLFLLLHPSVLPYYFFLTTTIAVVPQYFLSVSDPAELQRLDRTQNSVWVEHRWLQEGVTEADMVSLCRRLNQQKIRYVYPHLTPSDEDGRLPPFSVETARKFRKVLLRDAPQVRVFPWIGGVKTGFRQLRAGTIRLESDSYLQTFADECVYLTDQLGFDGIHLNIEPVESTNPRFLEWLEYLKERIGSEKILSVAANKPSLFDGLNFSPLRSWDIDYFEAVGKKCDQLVIMNYDTGLSYPFFYSLFTREKMSVLLQRFAHSQLSCRIVLGVATYDDAPNHAAAAENIPSAIDGLAAALSRKDIPKRNFEGIALYAYWTTNEEEWEQFFELWLHRKDEG